MTTYEKIREIRNKTLHPDGVPLERNCEVKKGKPDWWLGKEDTEIYTIDGKSGYKLFCRNEKGQTLDTYIRGEFAQILGKPVSLQEILLMLSKNSVSLRIEVSHTQNKQWIVIENDNNIWIDLTKSIKDQSEETLLKLHSLLE